MLCRVLAGPWHVDQIVRVAPSRHGCSTSRSVLSPPAFLFPLVIITGGHVWHVHRPVWRHQGGRETAAGADGAAGGKCTDCLLKSHSLFACLRWPTLCDCHISLQALDPQKSSIKAITPTEMPGVTVRRI